MVKFTIRQATESDALSIVQFQLAMAKETEELILALDTVYQGVLRVIKEPIRGFYLVAVVEDRPVACMLVLNEWSDWRNGEVLWVHSLYVMPEYRRNHIFTTMYEHLKERVIYDNNLKGIRLYVEKRNFNAQRAYVRVGMTNEHYELFEWLK